MIIIVISLLMRKISYKLSTQFSRLRMKRYKQQCYIKKNFIIEVIFWKNLTSRSFVQVSTYYACLFILCKLSHLPNFFRRSFLCQLLIMIIYKFLFLLLVANVYHFWLCEINLFRLYSLVTDVHPYNNNSQWRLYNMKYEWW